MTFLNILLPAMLLVCVNLFSSHYCFVYQQLIILCLMSAVIVLDSNFYFLDIKTDGK